MSDEEKQRLAEVWVSLQVVCTEIRSGRNIISKEELQAELLKSCEIMCGTISDLLGMEKVFGRLKENKMAAGEINLTLSSMISPEFPEIDGGLFQAHLSGNKLKLIPVKLRVPSERCQVIIGGEQCGGKAGHSGKHFWSRGD